MNKVIYVPSFFKPIGKKVKKEVATGEKKKGFFGGEKDVTTKVEEWQQTGYSDRYIDGERLASDIAKAVSELNNDGFEVVSITPVTSGDYNYQWAHQKGGQHWGGSGYGFGYGYSYTEGMTIVAKELT